MNKRLLEVLPLKIFILCLSSSNHSIIDSAPIKIDLLDLMFKYFLVAMDSITFQSQVLRSKYIESK